MNERTNELETAAHHAPCRIAPLHITYCLSSLLLLLCFFDVSGDR